jgi:two-component system LytT family response regulator
MENQLIRAVIIDDNIDSATNFSQILHTIPMLKVAGIAVSIHKANNYLVHDHPHFLFLSDHLINDQSIILLNEYQLKGAAFYIIVTAENDHAAFLALKLSAIAYLVKPFESEKIKSVLENAIVTLINHEQQLNTHSVLNQHHCPHRIRFNTRNGFILTIPEHIVYILADWNYSELFLSDGKSEMLSMSIGRLEGMLSPDDFYRINRSIIVNLNHINKVDRKMRQCCIEISGIEKELKVAAKKMKELEKRLL